jgi:5'-3' exonuclease
MGIKHFVIWFKKNHPECITTVCASKPIQIEMDTLALDLNGIFHPCAQEIFKYGKYKPQPSLLRRPQKPESYRALCLKTFKRVCETIDELVERVQPKKRLLLAVDGVAGFSKMCQQRSRRYKSSKEASDDMVFDSCSITPGTEFMNDLNAYIDWYARHQIQNGNWGDIEVIFSSEKVPGEGEHKLKILMRDYCAYDERFCIYGLDADLLMLCLAMDRPNVYIYRDDMNNPTIRYILDIGKFSLKLKDELKTKTAVVDFILLCFMVGNDFLPQLPGLEILNDGIDILLEIYKTTCVPCGLVNPKDGKIRIQPLLRFFSQLAPLEKTSLMKKYSKRQHYSKCELMNKFFWDGRDGVECDFEGYKDEYYHSKLNLKSMINKSEISGEKYSEKCDKMIDHICHEYIKGLQWVLDYYCYKIPSWTWFYPYHYGPFLDDLAKTNNFQHKVWFKTSPCDPFFQLLLVLPKKSIKLAPRVLWDFNKEHTWYFPDDFEVDISGKRAEWEGIALLPMLEKENMYDFKDSYSRRKTKFSKAEKLRNNEEKTIVYLKGNETKRFESVYGDIMDCVTTINKIDL